MHSFAHQENGLSQHGYQVKLPEQNLFMPVAVSSVHEVFRFLSAWLFKIYRLRLEDGVHYVADIGFNQRLYFNKQSVRSGNKYFWRIDTSEPFEKVISIPMAFRLPVSVEIHNFHKAGINKFDFRYALTIVVPDSYVVARLLSLEREMPLKAVEAAVKEKANRIASERDYKQLFIASSQITQDLKEAVSRDRVIVETGLQIKEITAELLIGDQELFQLIKKIYARYEEAKSLSRISELEWSRYLEACVPATALQERTKRQEHIINALVALGLPISESKIAAKAEELNKKIFG